MDPEQRGARLWRGLRSPGGPGSEPNPTVDVQLIAKTTSLSLGRPNEASDSAPRHEQAFGADGGAAGCPNDAPPGRNDGLGAPWDVGLLTSLRSPWTEQSPRMAELGRDGSGTSTAVSTSCLGGPGFLDLPNEVLFQILSHLEVCDLLAISRTSRRLRALSLTPYLHRTRLRRTRRLLQPMLASPARPTIADLIRRSILLTNTEFKSRRLAHSLASIRLSRRLAARPTPEALVERCVLPAECLPWCQGKKGGAGSVAPSLVARKRAIERERIKDGLSRWLGSVWKSEVVRREENVRIGLERAGVGRVWRLRRYWERVSRGEQA
ncbi:hypothetical protein VTJ83DRAFT_7057 [Remersonia thermophila]|uniref:F-box domain-containing protein n=1 Tax=Remersonia thermophila TaxID=72144 RepID=A0ABR4D2F7_9PEZI